MPPALSRTVDRLLTSGAPPQRSDCWTSGILVDVAQHSGDATERVIRALEGIDAADLVLVEPPPSVWDGIEASIESGRGGLPGSPSPESPVAVVEYSIDASDVLAEVGAGWVDVAIDHGAPELARPDENRELWESIEGDEMRELWQLVVGRVRSEQSEVRVPFRCDSARARRWFEMVIAPVADGGVRFRSVLVFEEARRPIALLDPTIERDHASAPIALCSWCGRGRSDGAWLDIERLVADARLLERDSLPPVTPGICGSCREQMSVALVAQGVSGGAPG
jgi:hypothetical protein